MHITLIGLKFLVVVQVVCILLINMDFVQEFWVLVLGIHFLGIPKTHNMYYFCTFEVSKCLMMVTMLVLRSTFVLGICTLGSNTMGITSISKVHVPKIDTSNNF